MPRTHKVSTTTHRDTPYTLNIRGVPRGLVMEAKMRALASGLTLKAFLVQVLKQAVKEPRT